LDIAPLFLTEFFFPAPRTLGRYASWTTQLLSEEHKNQYFVPTVEGVRPLPSQSWHSTNTSTILYNVAEILMPPLTNRWACLKDDEEDLIPLLDDRVYHRTVLPQPHRGARGQVGGAFLLFIIFCAPYLFFFLYSSDSSLSPPHRCTLPPLRLGRLSPPSPSDSSAFIPPPLSPPLTNALISQLPITISNTLYLFHSLLIQSLTHLPQAEVEKYTTRELRAQAVVYEVEGDDFEVEGNGFELIGLMAIFDPPREDTKQMGFFVLLQT
jgi:hypothetical protein